LDPRHARLSCSSSLEAEPILEGYALKTYVFAACYIAGPWSFSDMVGIPVEKRRLNVLLGASRKGLFDGRDYKTALVLLGIV
jgi:hypothetical protein